MSKDSIYNELILKTNAFYVSGQLSFEEYYKISRLLSNPKFLSELNLDTLVDLFNRLRIDKLSSKIAAISCYSEEDVRGCLRNLFGINYYCHTL